MPVYVALLRGINVGGHKQIKMAALKTLCESIGLSRVRTLLQSGNVVFTSASRDATKLAKTIRGAIEKEFGHTVEIILRDAGAFETAIAKNPFPKEARAEPNRLLVMFLVGEPTKTAKAKLAEIDVVPEKLKLVGDNLYAHYASGIAHSKLAKVPLEKLLGVPGTARNWNTVTKLRDMMAGKE